MQTSQRLKDRSFTHEIDDLNYYPLCPLYASSALNRHPAQVPYHNIRMNSHSSHSSSSSSHASHIVGTSSGSFGPAESTPR